MIDRSISIRSDQTMKVFGSIVIGLAIACFIRLFIKYQIEPSLYPSVLELFNMDADKNIPVYFYVFLLIIGTLLTSSITLVQIRQNSPQKYGWIVLTLIVFAMSIDKAVRFHDYLIHFIQRILTRNIAGIIIYPLAIVLLIVGLAILVLLVKFLRDLPENTRKSFIIAACVYLSGALVLEMIGSSFYDYSGQNNLVYDLLTIVEESMEMVGIIAFIKVLIKFMGSANLQISFQFDPAP
jgi:hypothetical protein